MSNRIESLDSLRWIASMIVVIFHCLLSFNLFYDAYYTHEFNNKFIEFLTTSPLHTVWAGNEAVLLFFVLSGFVLSIPFFNGRQLNYPSYAIRRFFRIYIPYIVIMMVSVLLVMLFHEYKSVDSLSSSYENRWDHAVSLQAIVSYVLMRSYDITNVNGVVWTLFHEMKISLIFPLFIIILRRYNFIKGVLYALVLNTLLYFLLAGIVDLAGNNIFSSLINSFKGSLYYVIFFIFGAVLAKYKDKFNFLKMYSSVKKGMILIISLILINTKWLSVYIGIDNTKITDTISLLGILILFVMVLNSTKLNNFLTNKTLLWLGRISFSLYLIHIPVLMMTTIFLGKLIPIELAFILVPIICLPIAHFTYRFIEVPANNIGKRLAKLSQGVLTVKENNSV